MCLRFLFILFRHFSLLYFRDKPSLPIQVTHTTHTDMVCTDYLSLLFLLLRSTWPSNGKYHGIYSTIHPLLSSPLLFSISPPVATPPSAIESSIPCYFQFPLNELLLIASFRLFSSPPFVVLFLPPSCNPSLCSVSGKTAMMIAAAGGHTEIVRELVKIGTLIY